MAKRRRKKKGGLWGAVLVLVAAVGILFWQQDEWREPVEDLLNTWQSAAAEDTDGSSSPSSAAQPVDGEAKIWYLDVGQADCMLLQLPNGSGWDSILIDAGTGQTEDALCSWLEEQGVEDLTAVIATHPHEDHIGGMDAVLKAIPAESLYMPEVKESLTPTTRCYEQLLDAAKDQHVQAVKGQSGVTVYKEDGVKLELIGPEPDEEYDDLNEYSLVAKLTVGERSFLFTGDSSEQAEADMLSAGEPLSADVLKVGHHGSSTATTEAFLQEVNPQVAVISCGKGNSYGHPHEETMQRLQEKAITIYRTDEDGTIMASCDGTSIEWQTGLPSIGE